MIRFTLLTMALVTLIGLTSWSDMIVDGEIDDWTNVANIVEDGQDMKDSSGDIKLIQAAVDSSNLYLRMSVYGVVAPLADQTPAGMKNRCYYHWIIDADNDPATGFNNSAYEGNATNLKNPIGVETVVMIGWRDGKPNGIEAYQALDDDQKLATDYEYAASGDTLEAVIPLKALGLTEGSTVGFSAFQEGASDDWAVDWVESIDLKLVPEATAVKAKGKLATTWSKLKRR